MAITEYGQYMEPACKSGQLANYQDYTADTHTVEEEVPFGAAVQLNAEGTAITPIKPNGNVIGIALAQSVYKEENPAYSLYKPAAILKRGRIFVRGGSDVMNGQPVKVDPVTQKFVADVPGAIAINNAVFKANATADQLVEIEINLP